MGRPGGGIAARWAAAGYRHLGGDDADPEEADHRQRQGDQNGHRSLNDGMAGENRERQACVHGDSPGKGTSGTVQGRTIRGAPTVAMAPSLINTCQRGLFQTALIGPEKTESGQGSASGGRRLLQHAQ